MPLSAKTFDTPKGTRVTIDSTELPVPLPPVGKVFIECKGNVGTDEAVRTSPGYDVSTIPVGQIEETLTAYFSPMIQSFIDDVPMGPGSKYQVIVRYEAPRA